MLYIYAKNDSKDLILYPNQWFDAMKDKEWFNDPVVKDIIFKIDKTVAVKDEYMESPVFGAMPSMLLSGGCKTVILMYETDYPVYGSCCGDNCVESIIKVADLKDVHMYLEHCMKLPMQFEAVFPESGVVVHTRKEYVDEYYRLKRSKSRK